MKAGIAIAGVIIAAVAVFFIVPMVGGGSANVCQALEQHNVSQAAKNISGSNSGPIFNVINSVGQSFATGDTEAAVQTHNHPDIPSAVSCAASYWKSL
ncbi:MAG: hypothetical protein KGQ79_03315 [Proteobacteria bacterium]|nr:hypothetical protein [Pseudomonadota bacterium]